jgi:poly(3-hydroxybutyrate) depolymerase
MKSGTSRALGALILGILTFSAFSGAALAADLPAGKMETITVHGAALAGNLSGDTADRKVYVYLPPDYATHKRERFPVIYFLHGFAQDADFYAKTLGWPQTIDRGLATASLPGMIVVMPDAMTPYGGSMYSNSITTLPHAAGPRRARPVGSFHGRLRHAAHRDEISAGVRIAVCDERLLPRSARRVAA